MHSFPRAAARLLALSLACALAATADSFVVDAKGSKVAVASVEADDAGNLTVKMAGGGVTRKYDAKEYRRVITAKPREVGQAEAALAANKADDALKALSQDLFRAQRWLGWGGTIALLRAQAHMARKEYREAETALRDGIPYARREGLAPDVDRGIIESLYAQGKKPDAKRMLDELDANTPQLAGFSFLMLGRFLEEEGKKQEAALKYFTVILLFKEADAPVRKAAYEGAIKVFGELNDARKADIANMMKKEFP